MTGLALCMAACSDEASCGDATGAATDAGPDTDSPRDASDAGGDAPVVQPDAGSQGAAGAAGGGATDSGPGDASAAAQQCLMDHCMAEISDCMADSTCGGWMTCIQECGQDMMKCPTFCGLYYPSDKANHFIGCALDHDCMAIDFSSCPACAAPAGGLEGLQGMEGTWWFAAFRGGDYLFDYDCQRLDFEAVSASELSVVHSVPLTRNGDHKLCTTVGTFAQQSDDSVLVVYDSFLGYHEDWYIVHRSDNALVAHVCFASDGDSKEYGTLILARSSLETLGADEQQQLEDAIATRLQLQLDDFTPAGLTGCENATQ